MSSPNTSSGTANGPLNPVVNSIAKLVWTDLAETYIYAAPNAFAVFEVGQLVVCVAENSGNGNAAGG